LLISIAKRIRSSPHSVPLLVILLAIGVANAPALLHLVTINPLSLDGLLALPKSGLLPGQPYADPNAGYTAQALGHLAALDWLHGHVPWWNPFEGLGMPLAGEMESGAFFPPTLVLAVSQGVLVLRILLEAIAGIGTYLLVQRLGVGRLFSTVAGLCLSMCGTFALFLHAPMRPVAFLPLSLLGVELALKAATDGKRGGWYLLALSLALSILAGFPETALIDAVLVGWWSLLRLVGPGRPAWPRLAAKLVTGVVVAMALAAPLLIAFADYLPQANVGPHGGTIAYASLPTAGLAQIILPYSIGPISAFNSTGTGSNTLVILWGNIGGFLGSTLIVAGLVGLLGKRDRILRLGLGGWIAVCLLRSFGFPPVVDAMAHIPGIRLTAFFRYAPGSWELAAVVLAAMGLNDIARLLVGRTPVVIGSALTALLAIWAAVTAWPLLTHSSLSTGGPTHGHLYDEGSLGAALVLLAVFLGGCFWATKRAPNGEQNRRTRHRFHLDKVRLRGRFVMAGAIGIEAILLFGFPYLSAPSPTVVQTASIDWLQSHLGTYRFATLGPIQPNYGSYFGTAEVNIDDDPTPNAYMSYVYSHLDTNAPANNFTALARRDPTAPTSGEELTAHLSNYEAIGVRFVVEWANGLDGQGIPFPSSRSLRGPHPPKLVYKDAYTEIWQLPHPAPVFSLGSPRPPSASDCTVVGSGWNLATVTCSHAAVIVRRVQYVSGWTAVVRGRSVPVRSYKEGPPNLFQAVSVPAGQMTIVYRYVPPREQWGVLAAGLAILFIIVAVATRGRRIGVPI
jgi:hypothetical protein